jgi:glycosyltransferase involved in cell wall biosynthesis
VRLLFVVQRYGDEALGGAERHCRDFARRLAARGHHVEVASSCARSYVDWADHYAPGASLDEGVTVHRFRVRAPRDYRRFGPLNDRVMGTRGAVAHVVEREWMRMQGPDVPDLPAWLRSRADDFDAVIYFTYLYATSFDGILASTGLIPSVLHPLAHDEPALRLGIFDMMLRAADAIAYNTEEEKELVHRRFGITRPSVITGTGIDTRERDEAEHDVAGFRRRFGLGDGPYLLYVGRIDPGKGSTEMAEMFAARTARRGRDVALVALGDPVTTLPPESGVVMTGAVDDATKEAAIAGCLALVQPSYYESLSMVLLEAWAHRRPALVQARCEVLVGQARRSGGAIPYAGFAEFEAAIDLLVEQPDLAAALGASGRRYVESRYAWDDVLGRYERFLEEAVAQWRPSLPGGRRPAAAGA